MMIAMTATADKLPLTVAAAERWVDQPAQVKRDPPHELQEPGADAQTIAATGWRAWQCSSGWTAPGQPAFNARLCLVATRSPTRIVNKHPIHMIPALPGKDGRTVHPHLSK
ncbi:hypothetical protein BVH03_00705 [Pseudomonas sp. PA15(2017)]|nr:hypothetical protein BVH03_00705 [Pseudomonas sp. PA15(2017)]